MARCKICREPFKKLNINHKTCPNVACAIELVRRDKEKKAKKETRERKVAIRSRADWLKLAQESFNAFIRKRDEHLPCICCGGWAEQKYGGSWDAGHYLSRGAYPELRFEEDNCHKQLKTCNGGSGRFAHKQKTVAQSYREGLILKIGLERVEWLEGPHNPKKWTIPELQEICALYKKKLKEVTHG